MPVLQVPFNVLENIKLLGRKKDAEDGAMATMSTRK